MDERRVTSSQTTQEAGSVQIAALATWMIVLAQAIVADAPLPLQKTQQRLTPQRVQQSIRPIFALIGTPARPPKRRGIPPGWPKGKRSVPVFAPFAGG